MIRPATAQDAHDLARLIRAEDRRELEEVGNRPLLSTLLFGVLASAPATAFFDPQGNLGGIVGAVPRGNASAAIWMACTDAVNRLPLTFLRASREYLETLPYDTLFNVIDARNEVHLNWIKWLGFTLIRRIEEYGPNRVPVYEFARIKPCVTRSR